MILIKNSNFLSTFKFITNLIKLFENLYFNYIDKLFDDLSFLESDGSKFKSSLNVIFLISFIFLILSSIIYLLSKDKFIIRI